MIFQMCPFPTRYMNVFLESNRPPLKIVDSWYSKSNKIAPRRLVENACHPLQDRMNDAVAWPPHLQVPGEQIIESLVGKKMARMGERR